MMMIASEIMQVIQSKHQDLKVPARHGSQPVAEGYRRHIPATPRKMMDLMRAWVVMILP